MDGGLGEYVIKGTLNQLGGRYLIIVKQRPVSGYLNKKVAHHFALKGTHLRVNRIGFLRKQTLCKTKPSLDT